MNVKTSITLFGAIVLSIILSPTTYAQDSSIEIPLTKPGSNQAVYVQVIDSCDYNFGGNECLNVRSGPSIKHAVVERARNAEIFMVDRLVINNGVKWYRLNFDNQYLYYPERLSTERYISGDYVRPFIDHIERNTWEHGRDGFGKKIVIDLSDQTLHAYDGSELFFTTAVSTGNEISPTEVGTYELFKKTPSRYMQGPIPDSGLTDEYDLAGVPWNMYFSASGAVIHGAYWHNNFGSTQSHGCVNLVPVDAKILYDWAETGATVVVEE